MLYYIGIYIPLDLGTLFFQGIYDKVKLYPEDMVQTCVLTITLFWTFQVYYDFNILIFTYVTYVWSPAPAQIWAKQTSDNEIKESNS